MIEGSRLVFVGGLHRSGTTPLARALASHPEISGLEATGVWEDEGQHLQDVYPKIKAYGGVGKFARHAEAHLTETSSLVAPDTAARLLAAWTPYWDTSRRLLLEKSPSNLIMGRFLQATFPGSAMVVVIRHPVVVALASHKWNPKLVARNGHWRSSLVSLVENWFRAHDAFAQDRPHLQRLHVLRYEDLVTAPQQELAPVQDLLGLSSPVPAESIRSDKSNRYAVQWDAMRSGGLIDRRSLRIIEERYAERAAAYGYSLTDLTTLEPWLATD